MYGQSTQLILLGTGTPNADPDRSGPSLAIVVNQVPYIVDCGPGLVRRAAAAYGNGIKGLNVPLLNTLFISHLHSDHTIGFPDFILTPAVLERKGPVKVFGPKGIKNMTRHVLKAYREDIDIRLHGLEHGDPRAYQVDVHEIKPGIIYRDSNITVKAFKVNHGSWKEAFGYRFETPDKIIVFSGDCTYSESLVENAKGCDILVHEVYSEEGFASRPAKWKAYHAAFHTSSGQLATIANKVNPKLLVLTHQLIWTSSEERLLKELRAAYQGAVVSGHDLDVY
jgi:ribonuclease BN (tRNA processing enzyme)